MVASCWLLSQSYHDARVHERHRRYAYIWILCDIWSFGMQCLVTYLYRDWPYTDVTFPSQCGKLRDYNSVTCWGSRDLLPSGLEAKSSQTEVYQGLGFNPLNPELNPICYLLALLRAHHFLQFSRIRVKLLTFRLLMSYIWSTHSWCF